MVDQKNISVIPDNHLHQLTIDNILTKRCENKTLIASGNIKEDYINQRKQISLKVNEFNHVKV